MSDGDPRDRAARLTDSLDDHRGKLLGHHGDGIGRHESGTDMPHHDSHGAVADPEQSIAHQYRDADPDILPHQIAALHLQIPDLHPDLLFSEEEKAHRDRELADSRDQRSQRRPPHFQARRTEVPENKHPVKEDIDEKRAHRRQKRNIGLPHAPQHQTCGQGDSVEQITRK